MKSWDKLRLEDEMGIKIINVDRFEKQETQIAWTRVLIYIFGLMIGLMIGAMITILWK